MGEPVIRPQEIVRAIRAAPLIRDPFPHLRLTRVLGEPSYREAIRLLPPVEHFVEFPHKDAKDRRGGSTRLELLFAEESLRRLDPDGRRFWQACADALADPEIAAAFATRFPSLAIRDGVPRLPSTGRPRMSLVRDLPGYTIRPHQDVPPKLLTVQVYLPDGGCWADALGTQLYRSGNGVLERAGTIPFQSNTGYAFPVTEASWHGVDPIPTGAPARISLMLIWYSHGLAARLRSVATRVRRALVPTAGA